MNKTALDPQTIAEITAIPTDTKLLIIFGVLVVVAALVFMFKFWAAIPFALAFGGTAYVAFTDSGAPVVGMVFGLLTGGVLWLGSLAAKQTKSESKANA